MLSYILGIYRLFLFINTTDFFKTSKIVSYTIVFNDSLNNISLVSENFSMINCSAVIIHKISHVKAIAMFYNCKIILSVWITRYFCTSNIHTTVNIRRFSEISEKKKTSLSWKYELFWCSPKLIHNYQKHLEAYELLICSIYFLSLFCYFQNCKSIACHVL